MDHKTGEDQPTEQELAPTEAPIEAGDSSDVEAVDTAAEKTPETEEKVVASSVQANTHAKKRSKKSKLAMPRFSSEKRWTSIAGLAAGAAALIAIVLSGVLSQYFKGKAMPGVSAAGVAVSAHSEQAVREQLEKRMTGFTVALKHEELSAEPKPEDIGLTLDLEKTVEQVMNAKRQNGITARLAFWKKVDVPVVVAVDEALLSQYVEGQFTTLHTAPQDAHLEFDAAKNSFVVTGQADGKGVDLAELKQELIQKGERVESADTELRITTKAPKITQAKLETMTEKANEIVGRNIVLTGVGTSFRARPADIAAWVTPTPQEDGTLRLVVDPAKVQGYVDAIGKRIANQPQDRKVLRDSQTGQEVIIQEGRAGTTLEDSPKLAEAITKALQDGQDSTQEMRITTADFKTVSMEAYDRWVEVDLRNQRTTLYTGSTAVQTFTISSGLPRTPTVTGEFKVWHKTTSQTMSGGSRAAGDFYSLPNVKWNTYFYKDYAFHTAYWHNNFGQPMSHGCVNMREADAKILYDFAPIGTTVIVHN